MLSIITREDLERELISARHNLRIGAEALWASDERYRRMVEDLPTMVFRFSADGRVTYANRALCDYYERSPEEILGTWVLSPIDQGERDSLWERVRALRPERPVLDCMIHAFPRSQDRRLQRWRIRGIFGPGAEGLAYQAVGEDITWEAVLEARAQRAEKMEAVGLLAGGIAHDFNNLLMVIWSCAEVACRRLSAGTPEARDGIMDALRDIRRSADSAALMTRQLVALSRDEQVDPEPLQLAAIIESVKPILERILPRDVRLEIAVEERVPEVLADATEMERVLVNLVANARDAVDPLTGVVRIDLGSGPHGEGAENGSGSAQVVLRVSDNGFGMDAATRKRIFDPFFTTKGDAGTGFGLATVYAIVERARGHIDVESEPEVGTTFVIRLPRYRGGQAADRPTEERVSVVGETIWYCEGDARIRKDVLATLEGAGYHVETAPDAQTLLTWVDQAGRAPSLVLTDSIAPGMPGEELVAAVRKRYPHVPAVFVSGRPYGGPAWSSERPVSGATFVSGRSADGATDAGADWFVRKPYRRQDLLARVADALADPGRDARRDAPQRPA